MNLKLNTIIAVAALCAAVSAVSCGKDKNSSSSDVILDIKTTTVSAESTTSVTTTSAATTTKAKATTTTAVTTAAPETEPDTVAVEVPQEEEVTPEEPEYIEDDPDDQQEAPQEEQHEETPAAQTASFSFGSIDQPISSITNVLGNGAQSKVPSCIPKGDGSDENTVYTYPGLQILCYSSGGTEYIGQIDISDGSYVLDTGIKVGSSKAEVTAAYGNAGSSGNDLYADSGDKEIYFYMSGDTVSKITIS